MTLTEFLNYLLSASGISAAVGLLLSFVLEMWPGFNELDPRAKRLLTMALSFALPLGATLGLYGLAPNADQVWAALMSGFVAFFGSQAGHLARLRRLA